LLTECPLNTGEAERYKKSSRRRKKPVVGKFEGKKVADSFSLLTGPQKNEALISQHTGEKVSKLNEKHQGRKRLEL